MDIAAIINAAIAQAIEATIATHLTQVQQDYANKMGEMAEKIAKLEARVAEWETTERLPAPTPATITADAFVNYLDNQEWFWAKINSYVAKNIQDGAYSDDWMEKVKEIADAAAEEAISDHADEYDHDDYDRAVSAIDDFEIDEDMVRDTVKEMLRSASVSIDI